LSYADFTRRGHNSAETGEESVGITDVSRVTHCWHSE